MVYKCNSCGESWWSEDCPTEYKGGGSGVIVCPECSGGLSRVVGAVEKSILVTLVDDDPLSLTALVRETEYDENVVRNALRHLLDMGYLGTTPGWDYRLGTRGREKAKKIAAEDSLLSGGEVVQKGGGTHK